MAQLRPVPGINNDSAKRIFIPTKLELVSNIFVRIDSHRTPLQSHFEGPFAVLDRRDKVFKVQFNNRVAWISADRLKPIFVLRDDPVVDHSYAVQAIDHHTRTNKQVCFFFPGGSNVAVHRNIFHPVLAWSRCFTNSVRVMNILKRQERRSLSCFRVHSRTYRSNAISSLVIHTTTQRSIYLRDI